jgi:chromosome segregation ATPase
VAEYEAQLSSLKQANESLQQQLAAQELRAASLKEEIQSLQLGARKAALKLKAMLSAERQKYESVLQRAKDCNSNLVATELIYKKEINSLKVLIDAQSLEKERQLECGRMAAQDSASLRLREKLAAAQWSQDRSGLQLTINKLTSALAVDNLTGLRQSLAQSQGQVQELTGEVDRLSEENRGLRASMARYQASITQLQKLNETFRLKLTVNARTTSTQTGASILSTRAVQSDLTWIHGVLHSATRDELAECVARDLENQQGDGPHDDGADRPSAVVSQLSESDDSTTPSVSSLSVDARGTPVSNTRSLGAVAEVAAEERDGSSCAK